MKKLHFSLALLGAFSLAPKSFAVTIPFSAASDYDNNFYETINPADTSWTSANGGSLAKGNVNSATVAIFNTTATGGTGGSGGTGAAVVDNNTFTNFTYALDFSTPALLAAGNSAGFITGINASATSGYFAIFRLTGSGSADFRVWDTDSNPTTGALGTMLMSGGSTDPSFTIPANSFSISTYYTLELTVADVGGNEQFTGAIFTEGGGTQISNSITFTDTTAPVTGPGQVGLRLGSNAAAATDYKNVTITPTAVPEPATGAFLGLVGCGLLARRPRRSV